jgi:transcriptional regulator with XRE-family HTH domain
VAHTAPPEFVLLLGERVRSLRRHAGLTVQQLADRSGVSRRMLTQIELGQANPSLVTVDKVAQALGADFAGLVLPDAPEPLTVYPAGSARPVWTSPAGSRALLHAATSGTGGPELWTWTLVPGDRYPAEPDPPGSEELFLVRAGTLTVLADGCAPVQLTEGSAARLASDRHYSYLNSGDEPVVFLRVVDVRAARHPLHLQERGAR